MEAWKRGIGRRLLYLQSFEQRIKILADVAGCNGILGVIRANLTDTPVDMLSGIISSGDRHWNPWYLSGLYKATLSCGGY